MARKNKNIPSVKAVSTAAGAPADEPTTEDDNRDDEEEEEEDEEEELELLQVDLGDMVKLKQVLDESVAGALLENQKLPEDHVWDNWKLGIMTAACCFAMFAQFAPIPFPESRPVLGICGSLYFALSGVLQLMATFVDRDAILWTLPVSSEGSSSSSAKKDSTKTTYKNKELMKFGLKVRSSLPRFSEWYTVTIEIQPSKKDNPKKPPRFVQQKWSVGQFFDKEGYFDEVGLSMELDKLFERLDQGKYDVAEDLKAKKD